MDALVFVSDKDYLDSISLSPICFQVPEKIYDILANLKQVLQVILKNKS